MRYSVKTLMLLPLIIAVASWMFLLGLDRSKTERNDLAKERDAARTAAEVNKQAASMATAAATLDRQVRDQMVQETRLAMNALIALAIEIRTKAATTPEFRDSGNRMLAQLGERLKETADSLRAATGADFASQIATAENDALIWSHLDLGEALAIVGGTKEDGDADARREFQEAQDLARSIAHAHPGSAQALSNLFVVEARFGDFNRQAGRSESARENYRDALAAAGDFDSVVPRKATLPRRVIAVLLARDGDAQLQSGLALAAADSYEEALTITRDASLGKTHSVELERDLALLYGKLGDAYLLATDATQTPDSHQGGFDVNWTIVTSDPQAPAAMRDDCFRFPISGDGNRRSDDLARARDAYQNSLAILGNLSRDGSEHGPNQADLAHGSARLGCLELAAENHATASESLEKAIAILAQLTTSDAIATPERDAHDRCLIDLREKLAYCKQARSAIDDFNVVKQRPKSEMPQWLALRGRALARSGRGDEAAATADLLARIEARRGENLLAAAEIYAILALGTK
ncbi:MAG TPA: hypothetical protein VKB78_15510, partial [Pirellulales bacterium]|nr:hypothetical protein [Pirellulales bacterium]